MKDKSRRLTNVWVLKLDDHYIYFRNFELADRIHKVEITHANGSTSLVSLDAARNIYRDNVELGWKKRVAMANRIYKKEKPPLDV